MTQEQKIIRAKVGLLELAKQLGNVSQACKMMGYSRDSPRVRAIIGFARLFHSRPEVCQSPPPRSANRLAAGGKRIRTVGPPYGDDGCRHTRFDRSGIETVRCSNVLNGTATP
jgi:hypothetical protein